MVKEVNTPSNKFRADVGIPKPKVAGDPDYLPPMILIGPDPSVKKSKRVWFRNCYSQIAILYRLRERKLVKKIETTYHFGRHKALNI